MKLWQKSYEVNESIDKFTTGKDKEMDLLLADSDVLGTMAHIAMLTKVNLLSREEYEKLKTELKNIYKDIKINKFTIEDGVEDVHSQVELLLTRKLGDIGKKVHSGRSRNDQVLVDLKIFFRDQIEKIVHGSHELFALLIAKSNSYKDVLMPGYTHFQAAMPSSFGLWFGAYAESLVDDLVVLRSAYEVANKNPLGSAAGYGSSFPLDRKYTTHLLGFDDLNYNVVYAQMGRGKTEMILANALSSIAFTLNKMAEDVCLFMSQNFAFVSFPDDYTTGSSIMPHKKNPDVFELIRAKTNRIKTLPGEINQITANLPSGYHRDLQLIKESILPAFGEIQACIDMTCLMLKDIRVRENILEEEKYKHIFSVEKVNEMVLTGVPFRDAYKEVGKMIEEGTFDANHDIDHTHEGSIGNLCNDEITENFEKVLSRFDFERKNNAVKKLFEG